MNESAHIITADCDGREITWSFDELSAARAFWYTMRRTKKTPDTGSPVFAAQWHANGKLNDHLSE